MYYYYLKLYMFLLYRIFILFLFGLLWRVLFDFCSFDSFVFSLFSIKVLCFDFFSCNSYKISNNLFFIWNYFKPSLISHGLNIDLFLPMSIHGSVSSSIYGNRNPYISMMADGNSNNRPFINTNGASSSGSPSCGSSSTFNNVSNTVSSSALDVTQRSVSLGNTNITQNVSSNRRQNAVNILDRRNEVSIEGYTVEELRVIQARERIWYGQMYSRLEDHLTREVERYVSEDPVISRYRSNNISISPWLDLNMNDVADIGKQHSRNFIQGLRATWVIDMSGRHRNINEGVLRHMEEHGTWHYMTGVILNVRGRDN